MNAILYTSGDTTSQELTPEESKIFDEADKIIEQNSSDFSNKKSEHKSHIGLLIFSIIFFIVFLLFINICTPIFFSTIMGNSITSGRYMQLLPSFFHIFTKAFLKIFVFFHSAARLFPVFLSFLAESMPYWN